MAQCEMKGRISKENEKKVGEGWMEQSVEETEELEK
jgi:hypothetical protein